MGLINKPNKALHLNAIPLRQVSLVDGGYAVAYDSESFGTGEYDFSLVKLSAICMFQWEEEIGIRSADKCKFVFW